MRVSGIKKDSAGQTVDSNGALVAGSGIDPRDRGKAETGGASAD